MKTMTTNEQDVVKEGRESDCESCRLFDHNACEYAGIDGFCCCEDEDRFTMPETLTETELREIEAHFERLTAPNEPWESKTEKADAFQNVAGRYAPALCRSLRAAWAANQQIIEVVDDTNKQIQSLKSENAALRAQLAQAQARILELETEIDTKAGYL